MSDKYIHDFYSFGEDYQHKMQVNSRTGEMLLNGEKLITEKRWSSTERTIAIVGLVIGGLATLATVVSTLVDLGWLGPSSPT